MTEEARQSFEWLVALRRDLVLRNQAVTQLQAEVYRACLEESRYEQQLGHTVASSRAPVRTNSSSGLRCSKFLADYHQ